MKFILAQPAIRRFQWELDVLLTNINKLGNHEVILLFTENDLSVVQYLKDKYQNIEILIYPERDDTEYIPSVKPYLFYRYLAEDKSRENDTYFYIDSDIIFRELPDFSILAADDNTWIGSDCGGYLDYHYLSTRIQGGRIVQDIARIIGVSVDDIKNTPGAGAQWYLTKPTAEYWLKVYRDSNALHKHFEPMDTDLQKWTVEMWAQLYNSVLFGKKVVISSELDFCRPTDDIKMWGIVKILHNAGITPDKASTHFYKGQYGESTPFGEDFSFVRRDKCSIKYVEAIKAVMV